MENDLSALQGIAIVFFAYRRFYLLVEKEPYIKSNFNNVIQIYTKFIKGKETTLKELYSALTVMCNGMNASSYIQKSIIEELLYCSRLTKGDDDETTTLEYFNDLGTSYPSKIVNILKSVDFTKPDVLNGISKKTLTFETNVDCKQVGYLQKLIHNICIVLLKNVLLLHSYLLTIYKVKTLNEKKMTRTEKQAVPNEIQKLIQPNLTTTIDLIKEEISISNECYACGKSNDEILGSCVRCRRALYCNEKCMLDDFKEHRTKCRHSTCCN